MKKLNTCDRIVKTNQLHNHLMPRNKSEVVFVVQYFQPQIDIITQQIKLQVYLCNLFNFCNVAQQRRKKVVFYDKFIQLCKENGEKPTVVAVQIGLNKSSATAWKKGAKPSDVTIAKLAGHFGVSPSFFDEQKENATTVSGDGVSERDLALLNWFRSLPEEKRRAILIAQDAPSELL